MERLCDSVVRLEAFAGSDKETNPIYQDYHGGWGRGWGLLGLPWWVGEWEESTRTIMVGGVGVGSIGTTVGEGEESTRTTMVGGVEGRVYQDYQDRGGQHECFTY